MGKTEIAAHRVVLAAFSHYFYAMFTNDMLEASQPAINMKQVDSLSMQLLVDYAYTGMYCLGSGLPKSRNWNGCLVKKCFLPFVRFPHDRFLSLFWKSNNWIEILPKVTFTHTWQFCRYMISLKVVYPSLSFRVMPPETTTPDPFLVGNFDFFWSKITINKKSDFLKMHTSVLGFFHEKCRTCQGSCCNKLRPLVGAPSN